MDTTISGTPLHYHYAHLFAFRKAAPRYSRRVMRIPLHFCTKSTVLDAFRAPRTPAAHGIAASGCEFHMRPFHSTTKPQFSAPWNLQARPESYITRTTAGADGRNATRPHFLCTRAWNATRKEGGARLLKLASRAIAAERTQPGHLTKVNENV